VVLLLVQLLLLVVLLLVQLLLLVVLLPVDLLLGVQKYLQLYLRMLKMDYLL
jgi:hypothetical protein